MKNQQNERPRLWGSRNPNRALLAHSRRPGLSGPFFPPAMIPPPTARLVMAWLIVVAPLASASIVCEKRFISSQRLVSFQQEPRLGGVRGVARALGLAMIGRLALHAVPFLAGLWRLRSQSILHPQTRKRRHCDVLGTCTTCLERGDAAAAGCCCRGISPNLAPNYSARIISGAPP
jgi:hypothetical protein